MTDPNAIPSFVDKMILSASGWRALFGDDEQENSLRAEISGAGAYVAASAARIFINFVKERFPGKRPTILLGMDTRPTGPALASAALGAFKDVEPLFAGVIAIPEFLAYCAGNDAIDGFFYISASHNPSGYNGFKFGFGDGALLGGEDSALLITRFKNDSSRSRIEAGPSLPLPDAAPIKTLAYDAYAIHLTRSAFDGDPKIETSIRASLKDRPLRLLIDFNGSARTLSVDVAYLRNLGVDVTVMNDVPGEFAHRIVPEGEGLAACAKRMERDKTFDLGIVPDCDGDRGNFVFYDPQTGKASLLDAQMGFSLFVTSELAYQRRLNLKKIAVVANDATSLRIRAICDLFGADYFTVETGEANVIALSRAKRAEGYAVRICGEGSNGGNITHPSTVRDPLNSFLSLLKLLYLKDADGAPGLYRLQLRASGNEAAYRDDFTLIDVIQSLPPYVTTEAFEADAVLKVCSPPAELKQSIERFFASEWNAMKITLSPLDVDSYQIKNFEGTRIGLGAGSRTGDETGGLRFDLYNKKGEPVGFCWTRGSKTEPITRLMVDLATRDANLEKITRTNLRLLIAQADARS